MAPYLSSLTGKAHRTIRCTSLLISFSAPQSCKHDGADGHPLHLRALTGSSAYNLEAGSRINIKLISVCICDVVERSALI